MDEIRRFVIDGVESEFAEACNLNDIESKSDPESEPYRSMYKARTIWHQLKSTVDRHREAAPDVAFWTYLDAALDLKLGVNYMESEEKSTGEEHLTRCLSSLEGHRAAVEVCCMVQSALNHLGILNSDRGEPAKGLIHLEEAKRVYKDFVDKVGGSPWTVDDLFKAESYDETADKEKLVKRRTDSFEDAYTHTLYYLAQVHTKLGNSETAANYCRMTLQRQLDTHKYNPIDWAMNAATLSQYYVSISDFSLARHCLASAQSILKEDGQSDADDDEKCERMSKAWADLYRCWVKYGLALLEHSKERLYRDDDQNRDPAADEAGDAADQEAKSQSERFFELELTAIESRISDHPARDFDEARWIFKPVQSWLEAAKVYYKLDGNTSDHVEIVRDHSQLYKLLSFFDGDLERQCKMHKRRADMLENLLKALNRQFYLLVCRQLMFELGEVYSSMLDNKYEIVQASNSPPTEHARAKINSLAQKSIDNFRAYVDTLRNSSGEFPSQFQDDDERPALIAHFYIGRMYSKFISNDIQTKLANMKGSVDNYKFLVDYCKKNPDATVKVKQEREVCEEMVVLLPAKMEKMRATSAD